MPRTVPALAPITLDDLDRVTPDLDWATVNDLSLRLAGLSGQLLELECIRLSAAMLDDLMMRGHPVGQLEHVVVLALLRAAITKLGGVQSGHA